MAEERHASDSHTDVVSTATLRFAQLVVAVIASSLLLFSMLYFAIPGRFDADVEGSLLCGDRLLEELRRASSVDEVAIADERYSQCVREKSRGKALLMVGGIALVLVVTVGLYWTAPGRRLRRDRLVPLSETDAPAAVAALRELCTLAGVDTRFVWDPSDPSARALAFGRHGKYMIALGMGAVVALQRGDAEARAVILHELAHLRNADIDITYITIYTWWAFLILAVLPVAAASLFIANFTSPFGLLLFACSTAALALVVYVIRNSVLHAREFAADNTASSWLGGGSALARALAAGPSQTDRLPSAFRAHPDGSDRARSLRDPASAYAVPYLELIGAGSAAGLALPNLASLALLQWQVDHAQIIASAVTGLIGGALVLLTAFRLAAGERAGIAGTQPVWLGLSFGLGFVFGIGIATAYTLDSVLAPTTSTDWVAALVLAAALGILITLALASFVMWSRTVALEWTHSEHRWWWFAVLGGGVLLSVVIAIWYRYSQVSEIAALINLAAAPGEQVEWMLTAAILAWLTPLLPGAIKTRGLPTVEEGRADDTGIEYGLVLRWAIWALIAFSLTMLLRAFVLTFHRLFFLGGPAEYALVLQAVIAVGVARAASHLPLAHAMFAAFVSAAGMVTFSVALLLAREGVLPQGGQLRTLAYVVSGGAFVALIAGGSSVLLRRTTSSRFEPSARQPLGDHFARLGSAVIVALAAAGVYSTLGAAGLGWVDVPVITGAETSPSPTVGATSTPASAATPTQASGPGYRRVVDDTGTLSVDVPREWSDVLTGPWLSGGVQVRGIHASPNRAAYARGSDPGLDVEVYPLPEGSNLEDVLEVRTRQARSSCLFANARGAASVDLVWWLLGECGPNRVTQQYYALRQSDRPRETVVIIIQLTPTSIDRYEELYKSVLTSVTLTGTSPTVSRPTVTPSTATPTASAATSQPCFIGEGYFASSRNLCTLLAVLEPNQSSNRVLLDVVRSGDMQTQTLSVYHSVGSQEQRLWFATAKAQQPVGGDFISGVLIFNPAGRTQSHLVYVATRCTTTCGPWTAFVYAVVDGTFRQVFRTDTNGSEVIADNNGRLLVTAPDGTRRSFTWTGTAYQAGR
jgi:Zn-dependent protease with chaperone function